MENITLIEAKKHLRAWLDADLAIASAQAYKIDGRTVTRANVAEVKERINYWTGIVRSLEGGGRGAQAFGVIPRDL